jgi:MoxR-like ATPase
VTGLYSADAGHGWSGSPSSSPASAVVEPAGVQLAGQQLQQVLGELQRVIVGQDRVLERVLVALLAGGHCLLEGVPGLGKTLTVSTLAHTLGGTFTRLQFTPDLLPSDIVGTRVYRPSSERFDIELGPVFANFVLADEINRAPAKVQSALLEVMAERQVSLGGVTHPLPTPFLVLATQNPIESEGVYPLPEAQRDRFLMRIPVGYPSFEEEHEIVDRASRTSTRPAMLLSTDDVLRLQATAAAVDVDPAVQDYAVRLVLASREPSAHGVEIEGLLAYGASPRASIGLVVAGRALALIRGRGHVLPQDVYDVAYDVLNHRLVLSFDAVADGVTVDDVLVTLLTTVTAPRLSSSDLRARADGRRR